LEASLLTGKSQNIFTSILKEALFPVKKDEYGKEYLTVKKADIERIFNIICSVKDGRDNKIKEDSKNTDMAEVM
jgi:hypothetical protein